MVRVFLRSMLCVMSVSFCAVSSAQKFSVAAGDPPTTMSKASVLALLPAGCVLAEDMPTSYGKSWDHASFEKPYYLADVDTDGRNELVIAYYTEPHEYLVNGKVQEGFLERAHVRVYHWDQAAFSVQWQSDGWGMQFRSRLNPNWPSGIKNAFTETYFAVKDINQDKIPDILFTRTAAGPSQDRFEVWSWDRDSQQYKQIAASTEARLVDADHDGVLEIICDQHRGVYDFEPYILRWDQAESRYVRDSAFTEVHRSLFLKLR